MGLAAFGKKFINKKKLLKVLIYDEKNLTYKLNPYYIHLVNTHILEDILTN